MQPLPNDMDVLREQVHTLKERLAELVADFKHFSDEMKQYRHDTRSEHQKIIVDYERLNQELTFLNREFDKVQTALSIVSSRLETLDRTKAAVIGGSVVARWIWATFFAILLAAIAWALGKYG